MQASPSPSSTELAPMEALNERIKSKIKADFMSMLPDELFDNLVTDTSVEFFQKEMPELIKVQLRALLQEKLDEEFQKPEWRTIWTSNNYNQSIRPGEAVQRIIRESAPLLMEALIQGAVMNVVNSLQNNRRY
jgi:hypothetical protein